ncbi:UPF0496 protein [Nymphaea thermarum]|nr:UPF0496 protein [Nymphaea thermarum]
MLNKGSTSSSRCTLDEDYGNLFQKLCCFLEESRSAGDGVSAVNLVTSSVSLIDDFNRQTMELQHGAAFWPVIKKDKFLSALKKGFLDLSLEADDFLKSLLTNMKNLNGELHGLVEALLQWTPSGHREEEKEIKVLDKLWRLEYSFSKSLLESFGSLLKQHQHIVEKVQQQGSSLEKKVGHLKWLKKAISIIFAGFFLVASVCSIIAAALHAGPVIASIVAAGTVVASWQQLGLWVDKIWVEKFNELQQEKDLCASLHRVESNKEYVLRDLRSLYSWVYQLKEMLENGSSSEELLRTKESLQNELFQVIISINESMKQVESSKNNIQVRRNKYLN